MKTITFVCASVVAAGMFAMSSAALGAATEQVDFSNPAFAPLSGPTTIPYSAETMCERLPDYCAAREVVPAVVLTPELWEQLQLVNNYYNATIKPMTNMQQYGVIDYWAFPDSGYGDCKGYQLGKQRELERLGWPASDLLMTVVLDTEGKGHAVLIVRTDRGDLVLDNLDGLIHVWSETPYHYIKRQSQTEAGKWVAISDNRETPAWKPQQLASSQ